MNTYVLSIKIFRKNLLSTQKITFLVKNTCDNNECNTDFLSTHLTK